MKKENKVEITNNDTGLKLDYDDISPFTGNKCVLIESDTGTGMESRICMETGYTTTDRFTIGGKAIEQYEKFVPQLYKDTKFLDKTLNQIWYLSTMRTHVCCLYAEGTSKTDYKWKLAMVRSLDLEDTIELNRFRLTRVDQQGKEHVLPSKKMIYDRLDITYQTFDEA